MLIWEYIWGAWWDFLKARIFLQEASEKLLTSFSTYKKFEMHLWEGSEKVSLLRRSWEGWNSIQNSEKILRSEKDMWRFSTLPVFELHFFFILAQNLHIQRPYLLSLEVCLKKIDMSRRGENWGWKLMLKRVKNGQKVKILGKKLF